MSEIAPTISGRFDNKSASFELTGLYQASLPDEPRWAGPISISFLGSVDSAHSDELLSGKQPAWNPTLGFSKSDSGASGDDGSNGASQVGTTPYMLIRYIQRIISIYTCLPQLLSSSLSYLHSSYPSSTYLRSLCTSRHWTTWCCECRRIKPVVKVWNQDIGILIRVCTGQLDR